MNVKILEAWQFPFTFEQINPSNFRKMSIAKSATDKFITERYLKNSLYSFVLEMGLSKEYFDHWRYKYASENLEEFKKTNLYPQWLEARQNVLNSKLAEITTLIQTHKNANEK